MYRSTTSGNGKPEVSLRELCFKHALRQAQEAGCAPADGKVLAYMAEHIEYDYNRRFNVPRQHVRIAQTILAKNLEMHRVTVQKSIKRLIEAGLIIDTEHGTRNRKHLYMVTMNWSFSKTLTRCFSAQEAPEQPEVEVEVPRPVSVTKPAKLSKSGTVLRNGRRDAFCSVVACAQQLEYKQGWAIKFQKHYLTFCDAHKTMGIKLAREGWPEDKEIASRGEVDSDRWDEAKRRLQAFNERNAANGRARRIASQ